MGERIELPMTPAGTPEEQLRQMYSYLYRVAEALNHNLSEIGSMDLTDEERMVVDTLTSGEAGAENAFDWQQKESLKSLIIKTASFVQNKLNEYRINLLGEYVAEGKFGRYVRNTGLRVDITPSGIQQNFTFEEVVQGLQTYAINAKNYIKTGLLRTVQGLPVYGVAIGKDVVTFSQDGTETYNDGNKVAELTADELSFYQNSQKVASYTGSGLTFYVGGVAKLKVDSTGVTMLDGTNKLSEFLSTGLKFYHNNELRTQTDANGLIMYKGSTKLAEFLNTALKFYYNGTLRTQMDTNGVTIMNGTTKLAELLSSALTFYHNGELRMQTGSDSMTFYKGNTKMLSLSTSAGLSFYNNGTLRAQMDSNGVSFWNGNTKLAELTSSALKFYTASGRISFYNGNNEVMYIENNKINVAKDFAVLSTGNIDLSAANSLSLKAGSVALTALASKSLSQYTFDSLGSNSSGIYLTPTQVKISSGGTLDVSATNFSISSTNKEVTAGKWKFNDNGLYNYDNSNSYIRINAGGNWITFNDHLSNSTYPDMSWGVWYTHSTKEMQLTGSNLTVNAHKLQIQGSDIPSWTDLAGKKSLQTAKSSPSASGSTTAFIDTISQDANGVITATKKNVSFSGYKTTQTAKTSPTASGYTLGFIDTISQDANGVITATKKTVDYNDLYKIVSYTYTYTLGAGQYYGATANDFNVSTPSGYTPVAVASSYTGSSSVVIAIISATNTGTGTVMGLRNVGSSSVTATAGMSIMYMRSH